MELLKEELKNPEYLNINYPHFLPDLTVYYLVLKFYKKDDIILTNLFSRYKFCDFYEQIIL